MGYQLQPESESFAQRQILFRSVSFPFVESTTRLSSLKEGLPAQYVIDASDGNNEGLLNFLVKNREKLESRIKEVVDSSSEYLDVHNIRFEQGSILITVDLSASRWVEHHLGSHEFNLSDPVSAYPELTTDLIGLNNSFIEVIGKIGESIREFFL